LEVDGDVKGGSEPKKLKKQKELPTKGGVH